MAIRIAIVGNVIDFGVDNNFNLQKDLERILKQNFAILVIERFEKQLKTAKNILYLGDNTGESVFDKLLIGTINIPTTYAVRELPVIYDVAIEDAINSELDTVAKIISSGSPAPGTILELCSPKFIEIYNNADIVISKGQGNYEGLSEAKRSIFFLLKAKYPVIACDLNVKLNDIILERIN